MKRFSAALGVMIALAITGLGADPTPAAPPAVIIEHIAVILDKPFKITINQPISGSEIRVTVMDNQIFRLDKREYSERLGKHIFYFTPLDLGRSVIGFQVCRPDGTGLEEYRYDVAIAPAPAAVPSTAEIKISPAYYPFLGLEPDRVGRQPGSAGRPRESFIPPVIGDNVSDQTYLFRHASAEEQEQYEFAEEIFNRGYFDQAIAEYEKLLYRFPKGVMIELVSLRLGDALYQDGLNRFILAKEDKAERRKEEAVKKFTEAKTLFEKARNQYLKVKTRFTNGEYGDQAQYYVALSQNLLAKAQFEIDDYNLSIKEDIPRIQFEQAVIEYLKVIVTHKTSDYCDNARLNIGLFYKEMADIMLAQDRPQPTIIDLYNRALVEFEGTVKTYRGSDGAGYALYNMAIIYDQIRIMRNFQKAVDNYAKLIEEYQDHPTNDQLKKLADEVIPRMEEIKREYL